MFSRHSVPNSPSQILPASKERFAIHFGRLEELVERQRQFDDHLLHDTVVHEMNVQRRRIGIIVDTLGGQHLLNLCACFERRLDRFDLNVEFGCVGWRPVQNWRKLLKIKREEI